MTTEASFLERVRLTRLALSGKLGHDAQNPIRKYTYTAHDTVRRVVAETLAEHGLLLTAHLEHESIAPVTMNTKTGVLTLSWYHCRVRVEIRDSRSEEVLVGVGSGGDVLDEPQAIGSAQSYAFKYGVYNLLSLDTGGEAEPDSRSLRQDAQQHRQLPARPTGPAAPAKRGPTVSSEDTAHADLERICRQVAEYRGVNPLEVLKEVSVFTGNDGTDTWIRAFGKGSAKWAAASCGRARELLEEIPANKRHDLAHAAAAATFGGQLPPDDEIPF